MCRVYNGKLFEPQPWSLSRITHPLSRLRILAYFKLSKLSKIYAMASCDVLYLYLARVEGPMRRLLEDDSVHWRFSSASVMMMLCLCPQEGQIFLSSESVWFSISRLLDGTFKLIKSSTQIGKASIEDGQRPSLFSSTLTISFPCLSPLRYRYTHGCPHKLALASHISCS